MKILNKHRDDIRGAYYCGRGRVAGNPFIIGRDGDRDAVCDKYAQWAPRQRWWNGFIDWLVKNPIDLWCYCAPARCHCDFIMSTVEKRLQETSK
jgi:hypothetical protein